MYSLAPAKWADCEKHYIAVVSFIVLSNPYLYSIFESGGFKIILINRKRFAMISQLVS